MPASTIDDDVASNSGTTADRQLKDEEAAEDVKMADAKGTYKSWKKKYRKMRITFDQKMHEGEALHKQEQLALETVKRIAIMNE
jgi:hypothetical protein